MKIERNKIVFIGILVIIAIFLVSYTIMIMGDDEDEDQNLEQTDVPPLEEDNQEIYKSKLDAINDLKEVREKNVPSIYDEKLIDSLGYYDPELPEKDKERIIDSIYTLGQTRYDKIQEINNQPQIKEAPINKVVDTAEIRAAKKIDAKEMGLEHQLFFASAPKTNEITVTGITNPEIKVVVDGTQVVKANSRLRMRLAEAAAIGDNHLPKNTPVFGFISFQPNRVLIEIENIDHKPTSLRAFDLQDGSEGIYVENNFRAEATTEVLDDLISDINIPSVPQVSGIGKILRRNNRNVKVTVLNNYKLILKPKL